MTRVIAYIDGMNLYHGLRDRYGRRYHWLGAAAVLALRHRDGPWLGPSGQGLLTLAGLRAVYRVGGMDVEARGDRRHR
jgi:hypothetical protein